jgi:hypothetical protein
MSKKTYTPEEFNKATLAKFRGGNMQGMFECHAIFSESLSRLRQSLDDVWSIEYNGKITPSKQAYMDKLSFAVDTLGSLEELFQDEYFRKLDELKAEEEAEYEEEYHGNPT